MKTPAQRAYDKFAAEPLAKLGGVDRASFFAGYYTAMETTAELVAALQECLEYIPKRERPVLHKKISDLLAKVRP